MEPKTSKEDSKMRISHVNPKCFSEQEMAKLEKGQKVKTIRFGTIRLAKQEDMKKYPCATVPNSSFPDYLPIIW